MTDELDRGRRALLLAGGAFGLSAASGQTSGQALGTPPGTLPVPRPRGPEDEPPLRTAMLVYPRMVMLDLAGPLTVMNILRAENHLVAKTAEPVATDLPIPVTPTATFASCPDDLDLLFVPGGIMGTIACMRDEETLAFLAEKAPRARFVTSVCTGSLVLGAAGLLEGYEATSHWAVADLLPLMGAVRTDARVVRDRNRLTGGGVTAGIDLGLTIAAALRGEEAARRVQLILEYAPAPPFANGTPEQAGPERTAEARSRRVWMDGEARKAAEAAGRRLGLL